MQCHGNDTFTVVLFSSFFPLQTQFQRQEAAGDGGEKLQEQIDPRPSGVENIFSLQTAVVIETFRMLL